MRLLAALTAPTGSPPATARRYARSVLEDGSRYYELVKGTRAKRAWTLFGDLPPCD